MADAVGLAAGIIGIIQVAAKATSLSYGYFGAVKDAPTSAKKFMDELGALTRVLNTLEGCAQANPESAVLKELEEPVRKCVDEMKDISNKLNPAQKGWLKKKLARYKWPLKEGETTEYIKRLERHKSFFIIVLNADALTRSKTIGRNVEEVMEDVKDLKITLTDLKSRAAQDSAHSKRNNILEWLSPGVFDLKHSDISSRRQENTGDWLLKRPEFRDWNKKDPNSRLLWGYGIPGAGKTFLSSRVIDHLVSQAAGRSYGVAYIYFDYKERDQQRPSRVIASLTKQLLCQTQSPIPKEIEDQYKKFHEEKKTPTLQDQYNLLLIAVKSFTQTFIICDALDECDQKTQRRELLPLFHRMGQAGMNLFLTSREYPEDIQASLQNSARIRLSAQQEDITSYVERKIEENPRAKRLVNQGKCKEKITTGLIECAKGMFLLVHFHIEYLCQQTTVREILTELERIKNTVSEENPLGPTYDRAMEALRVQPKNCVRLAYRVLTWLVKAQRVLKIGELQLAVSVEQDRTSLHEFDLPDKKTLLEVCASLVTIDEQGDTIGLAHYTVQEYLLQNSIIPADADFRVARACTTFLSFDAFAQGACNSDSSLETRYNQHPFLKYAAYYLYSHLKACDEALSTGFVLRFAGRRGCILSYQEILFRHGLYGTVISYHGSGPKALYPCDWTPLHVAAYLGHYSVVKLLLEQSDVMALTADTKRTAMHEAAAQGHEAVVQLLIDNGASISATCIYGETPLSMAALHHHESVVRLLLKHGAKIPVGDILKDQEPLLNRVAAQDHVPMVRLLLEHGADASSCDSQGNPALMWAIDIGHEAIAQLLIEKGADLEARDPEKGRTPLIAASIYSRESTEPTVRLLLEKGADPLATDVNSGATALHYASCGGDSVIRLLVEKGADISARNNEGHSALHYAALLDRESGVRCLVEMGAELSARCDEGGTALHWAAGLGWEPIVEFLLEKGADTTVRDKKGGPPLFYAAAGAKESTARLLIEKGDKTSLSAIDNKGSTVLHWAVDEVGSRDDRDSVVRLLLEKGVDPSATNNDGRTALELAEIRGYESTYQILEMAMYGNSICE